MPELPEVETVRRQLERELVGAIIQSVEVREQKIFIGESKKVLGEKIVKIERVGKYIFVHFGSGSGLTIHLKMTGRLVLQSRITNSQILKLEDYETAKHTRVVITMKDSRKIYYWDTRKFGYLKWGESIEKEQAVLKEKMGPEPWDLSDEEFMIKLKRSGRSIKEVILDQNIISGVGNIYANDGLWLAGIDPRRKANGLKKREVVKLRESLCIVLSRGLKTGGASDNTYRDFYGGKGSYQDEFLTYGRTGEPCNKCGNKLERIVVGGRGSWVCRQCQV